jgi:hypothetical protein
MIASEKLSVAPKCGSVMLNLGAIKSRSARNKPTPNGAFAHPMLNSEYVRRANPAREIVNLNVVRANFSRIDPRRNKIGRLQMAGIKLVSILVKSILCTQKTPVE